MKKVFILSLALTALLFSGCGGKTYNNQRIMLGDASYCGSYTSALDYIDKFNATDYPSAPNAVYDSQNEIEENYFVKRAALELFRAMDAAADFGNRRKQDDRRVLNDMVKAARKLHEATPTRFADVIARMKALALCDEVKTESYYRFWRRADRYLEDGSNKYYFQFLEN